MKKFPVIAIDYGSVRLGIALSDSKGMLASPLKTIDIHKVGGLQEAIRQIIQIIDQYKAVRIVIGMPQAFAKEHEISQEKIRKFADNVRNGTGINPVFYDESFSTMNAGNVLLSLGHNVTSSRKVIDKLSAAIFLQNFLNSESDEVRKQTDKDNQEP